MGDDLDRPLRTDDGDPIVQWIFGTHSDGTLLMIKPKEGKTLTLKTGGDIDISADVTVADNQFAMLQMSYDAGGKWLMHMGGSGGSGVALTDSPVWTGKHVWDTDTAWQSSWDTDSEKSAN